MKSGPPATAQLLFLLFVHITAANNEITADDVQNLTQAMRDTTWTKTGEMRAAIAQLRVMHATLWAGYASKKLAVGVAPIAELLGCVCEGLSPTEVCGLRDALCDFVARVCDVTHPAASSASKSPDGEARLLARRQVEQLLQSAVAPSVVADTPPSGPVGPVRPVGLDVGNGLISADAWLGGPLQVRCVGVTHMTHDVKSYTFNAIEPHLFTYKPGQFVTIELSIAGNLLRRSYTISSSPTRPHTFSITVKRVPEGRVSNALYETMQVGFECVVNGPYGDFTCLNHPSDKLLLISGGSGVTPMMSMLRFLADTCAPIDVAFLNNVRTQNDIIFREELLYFSASLGERLKLHIVPSRLAPGQPWAGTVGPLSQQLLLALVPNLLEREVFVCGPAGYMDMVKGLLQDGGYPMHRFHMESFGGAPKMQRVQPGREKKRRDQAASRSILTDIKVTEPKGKAAEIFFKRSNRSVLCTTVDTILDVGESNGISLESSCRSGVCGACRLSKIEGDVIMEGQSALRHEDIEAGAILACVALPRGRVVIDA